MRIGRSLLLEVSLNGVARRTVGRGSERGDSSQPRSGKTGIQENRSLSKPQSEQTAI